MFIVCSFYITKEKEGDYRNDKADYRGKVDDSGQLQNYLAAIWHVPYLAKLFSQQIP